MSPILLAAAPHEEDPSQTHHWLWPEGYEILFGGLAALMIFALLVWKAGPVLKRGMAARTQRIQDELDGATNALSAADAEASRIREAKGDIETERQRMLADAGAQAEALLTDGRSRLEAEVADLEAKADADIASATGRVSDELRGEIGRMAAAASERVVLSTLDADAQQRLIEDYIARVGAASTDGATSPVRTVRT